MKRTKEYNITPDFPAFDKLRYTPETMAAKEQWPELVGKTGEEAKAIIENENVNVKEVRIIPNMSPVTADYREERVRIFVDKDGKVAAPPGTG